MTYNYKWSLLSWILCIHHVCVGICYGEAPGYSSVC